jgi:threonine/homoserine/homoserine lactone efflux protein
MIDSNKLTFFVVASSVLIVTPGSNVLYVVARSVSQGRLAGVVSVAGIAVGNFVHATAAAVGVSAILASSALAFSVLKYLGAAYLIFVGVRKFLSAPPETAAASFAPESLRRVFRQGVLIGTLNPKVALFFLSFLPQFVNPRIGSVHAQLLVFGIGFVAMAAIGDSLWAIVSGSMAGWIKRRKNYLRNERFVTGTVYCGLGVAAALSGPAKTG